MEKFKKIMREWIIPFTIEIILVLLVLKYVFFLARVPTGSMIPTFGEHSWLFVTRMYAPETTVQRGDIIVFDSDELGKTLVKRVVGLPGDYISLDQDGQMTVNGDPYPEPYVVNTDSASGEWEVPEGCYLFMGDNRANSHDARFWDNPYVFEDKLLGEARFVLWPPSNFGTLH